MSKVVLRRVLIAIVACVMAQSAMATNYASAGHGAWESPGTWTPLGVPSAGDNVSISHAVTMNALNAIDGVTVAAAGSLTLNDTLYVYGPTVVDGAIHANDSTASFSANITVNSGGILDFASVGQIILGSGVSSISGSGVVDAYSLQVAYTNVNVAGTTVNVSDTLTITQGSYAGTSPVYSIGANLFYQNTTGSAGAEWCADTNVGTELFIHFYSSSIVLPGTAANTFYAGHIDILSDASLNLGNANLVMSQTAGALSNAGILTQGAGDIRLVSSGQIFANDGTFSHGTGMLEFNATGFQQLQGPVTVGRLRIVNAYVVGLNTWTIQDRLDMDGTAVVSGTGLAPLVYDSASLNYTNFTGTVQGEWPDTNVPDQVTMTSSDVTLDGGPSGVGAASLQIANSSLTNRDASITVMNAVTLDGGSSLHLTTGGTASAGSVSLANGAVIRKDRLISVAGTMPYDLTGAVVGFASVPADVIGVSLHGGNVPNAGARVGLLTGRWWEITSGDSTVPSSVSLPTDFLPGTPDPYVCYYLGSPGQWNCARDSYGAVAVTRTSSLVYGTYVVGDQQLGLVPVSVSAFTID